MHVMDSFSTRTLALLVLSLSSAYALNIWLEFQQVIKSIGNQPGFRRLLDPATLWGNLLPPIRGVAMGPFAELQNDKHSVFERVGCDIYSYVAISPKPRPTLFIADPFAIKEVIFSRARFPKPIQQYTVFATFGGNILSAEGEEWRRYRKISAPAFSDRNNKLVWDETVKITISMFEHAWKFQEEVSFDHCLEVTLPLALLVIGVAGFGGDISWDDAEIPPGHQMSLKEALHIVSTDMLTKMMVPRWAMGISKRLRLVQLAFHELETYMVEMIRSRKASNQREERFDLFSNLLDANEEEDLVDGAAKLKDSELIGNIFIFLLAGHETTAHALCFTFALLALYTDEQEALYQHIRSVLPEGRHPTYEEMPLQTYSMAVLYETLRMFPPVVAIPKCSAEDTVLTTGNASGEKLSVPIPQGAGVVVHTPGLHYNPLYWDDPYAFKPSRFLKDWPREAFIPFSAGARGCLGRKFFETEAVAILTLLVSRYKIEVKEEPQFARESFEDRKARLLATKPGLTLTPVRVPLVFKRRH